jgi:succinyl-CoA synthetase alpha subunit
MAILIDGTTKVICQGITGASGSFHTKGCLDYGTQIVGGVTPGKGGQQDANGLPIGDWGYGHDDLRAPPICWRFCS